MREERFLSVAPIVAVAVLGMLAGGGVRDSGEPESFEILAAATAGALLAAVMRRG